MTIEELQEQLLQEQEAKKELQANYDKLKADNDKLTADNAELVKYNNKLFMRVSEPTKDNDKPTDLTPEEAQAKQIEDIRKLMQERR